MSSTVKPHLSVTLIKVESQIVLSHSLIKDLWQSEKSIQKQQMERHRKRQLTKQEFDIKLIKLL